MADPRTKALAPKILQEDLDSFAALKDMSDYEPSDDDYKVANGDTAKIAMEAAQVKAVQDAATANASRDDEIAAQWAFHDFVLGAKIQVKAQYGASSNQIQALGLKKKNEYKNHSKNNTPEPAT